MTPNDLMAGRAAPLRLVIFDCDGVLIDSEAIASRVVSDDLTALGWPLTPAESQAYFLGMSLGEMVPVIEARLGYPLPPDWRPALGRRLIEALGREAVTIPGAEAVLRATDALGLDWRVASNSSHEEMAVKFRRTGLSGLVVGRTISHRDVARPKPAPDIFLAAAARAGVHPSDCVVVEDSVTGVRGAVAAGIDVLGFSPHGDGAALRREGAVPFGALSELPVLFALGMAAGASA